MKTVFFDIDGTIVDVMNGVPHPSEKTIYAFNQLRKNGHRAIIASGRMKSMLTDDLLSLQPAGYLMCNGGIFEIDGCPTRTIAIDENIINEVMKACEQTGSIYYLENGYDIFTNGLGTQIHDKNMEGWDDPTEYKDISLRNDLPTIMLMVISENLEIGEKLREQFKDVFDITRQMPEYTVYDYNGKGTNKGEAIRRYIESEGLSKDDCYSFGDSFNDIEMTMAVGHGYVMGNSSCQPLRDIAEEIIDSVQEDGVYNKLVQLGLIEPMNK